VGIWNRNWRKMKKIKADISLGATEKEREREVKKIHNIQRLFKHFGVEAFAFDPGVRCCQTGKVSYRILDFDAFEWEWLEPLLKELLMYRRKHEKVHKES